MSKGNSRFSLGAVEEDEIVIPKEPMVTRPAPELVAQGREVQRSSPPVPTELAVHEETTVLYTQVEHDGTSVEALAQNRFSPDEPKERISQSIRQTLNKLINDKVYEMKSKGYKKITRDAVIEDALVHYFGVR
jgi:hypothetical protein